jgi:tetratricopeptide (TPR) repeat protein
VFVKDRDFSGALRLVNDFLIEHHTTIEKKQAPTLEDTLTTSFAMHNKAVLEMVNGIFKYAVNYFKEAADIKEALLGKKHTSVIETMEQLAVAMYGMEAYDQCHSTLRSIHSRCNSRAFEARTWNAIAVVHFQKGEHDFAFECARHATIKYEESEWSATIALANLGYIQLSRGEAEGKATLESAEEVSYGSTIYCESQNSRLTLHISSGSCRVAAPEERNCSKYSIQHEYANMNMHTYVVRL